MSVIEPVSPDHVTREKTIFAQIGRDMRSLRLDLAKLKACIDISLCADDDPTDLTNPDSFTPERFFVGDEGMVRFTGSVTAAKRDIRLVPLETGELDMALDADGDLLADNDLHTPILTSLFSDSRAETEQGNRERGWWSDTLITRISGSRLWLLHREKQTPTTLRRAEQYAAEALQWLLDDRIADNVSVAGTWSETARGYMHLKIAIHLRSGARFS